MSEIVPQQRMYDVYTPPTVPTQTPDLGGSRVLERRLQWIGGTGALLLVLSAVPMSSTLRAGSAVISSNALIAFASLPSVLWFATYARRSLGTGMEVVASTLLGALVAATLSTFLITNLKLESPLTSALDSGMPTLMLLMVCGISALTYELTKYFVLRYAQLRSSKIDPSVDYRQAISVALGFSASLFVSSSLNSEHAFTLNLRVVANFASVLLIHCALGLVLILGQRPLRLAASRRRVSFRALVYFWALLLLAFGFQWLRTRWTAFPALAASVGAFSAAWFAVRRWGDLDAMQPRHKERGGFGVLAVGLAAMVLVFLAASYKIIFSATSDRVHLGALTFSYPSAWPGPESAHSIKLEKASDSDSKDSFEVHAPDDPFMRVEFKMLGYRERGTLGPSLDLARISEYGMYCTVLSQKSQSVMGKDWLRTRFYYPDRPKFGGAPAIVVGEEFATVHQQRLFVLTLHAREEHMPSLIEHVVPTIQITTRRSKP